MVWRDVVAVRGEYGGQGMPFLIGLLVFFAVLSLIGEIISAFPSSGGLNHFLGSGYPIKQILVFVVIFLFYLALTFLKVRMENINTPLKAPVKFFYEKVLNADAGGDMVASWVSMTIFTVPAFFVFTYFHYDAISLEAYDRFFRSRDPIALIFEFLIYIIVLLFSLHLMFGMAVAFVIGIASLPFMGYALYIYYQCLRIKHPLEPYVKSGKPVPAETIEELSRMASTNEEGRVYPAYVYENYRIKTERLLQKLDRNEAKRQAKIKEDIERPIREAQRKREEEAARREREEAERLKQKIKEEEAQYGTKEQRERRAAFNKTQADLLNRYVKSQEKRHND